MERNDELFLQRLGDEQSFCDYLLGVLRTEQEWDGATTALEPAWVLQRLLDIKRQVPHVYYLSFLTPLQREFPRAILPQNLHAAMQGVDGLSDGASGDLPSEQWQAETEALYQAGVRPGYSPGWSNLAQHYTVRPGELTLITGISNHMKSTFVHGLCVNLARHPGWNISLFSPEHYPPAFLAAQLQEHYSNSPLRQMARPQFEETLAWVLKHFHVIQPPEETAPTLAYLLAVARRQVEQYAIKGLVLDPWNEIDHQYGGAMSETQYISECLSRLRRFARHHQVHVWIVAHPTKLQKAVSGPYKDKYPPATPHNVSGSAHWYNKPDNCLSIWRDVEQDSATIEVHVQKIRYRPVGKPGLIYLEHTGQQLVEEATEETTWHH